MIKKDPLTGLAFIFKTKANPDGKLAQQLTSRELLSLCRRYKNRDEISFVTAAACWYNFIAFPSLINAAVSFASFTHWKLNDGMYKTLQQELEIRREERQERIKDQDIRNPDGSPAIWSDIAKMKAQESQDYSPAPQ